MEYTVTRAPVEDYTFDIEYPGLDASNSTVDGIGVPASKPSLDASIESPVLEYGTATDTRPFSTFAIHIAVKPVLYYLLIVLLIQLLTFLILLLN